MSNSVAFSDLCFSGPFDPYLLLVSGLGVLFVLSGKVQGLSESLGVGNTRPECSDSGLDNGNSNLAFPNCEPSRLIWKSTKNFVKHSLRTEKVCSDSFKSLKIFCYSRFPVGWCFVAFASISFQL